MSPRDLLLGSFQAALAAADPLKIVPQHLPDPPQGRTLVVGAGKAAAAMALAVERSWPAGTPLDGLVITRYQHGLLTSRITVIEAAHPVPDESGEQAAQEILRRAKALSHDDLLLRVLHRLRDHGNTVVVIEHNLDVIKTADWVIDLGPEGGDGGGRVVAEGAPEEVARNKASYTGQYLKSVLGT